MSGNEVAAMPPVYTIGGSPERSGVRLETAVIGVNAVFWAFTNSVLFGNDARVVSSAKGDCAEANGSDIGTMEFC